jgi:hypothetical protein
MSVTALDEFELELVVPSTNSRAYIGPLLAAADFETPIGYTGIRPSPALAPSGLGCLRGAAFGLLVEAVAGLCLYGAWQLWHTIG